MTVPADGSDSAQAYPERILEVDLDHANAARVYDYFLGGANNFGVDRDVANHMLEVNPDIAAAAQANRTFLREAVRWCLDSGIDQFLDLGSGVPTVGNVHEIAHQSNPQARVAYVDFEPVAVAHATELINKLDTSTVTITRADIRDPESVLTAPGVANLLDFTRPVALLTVGILHFIAEDISALHRRYRSALVPGSAIALTHLVSDHHDPGVAARLDSTMAVSNRTATPVTLRRRVEVLTLFDDLQLAEPGVVDVVDWPEPRLGRRGLGSYGGVALVP